MANKQKTWTDGKGIIHFINEMDTSHLTNTIKMLERKINNKVKNLVDYYVACHPHSSDYILTVDKVARKSMFNNLMNHHHPVYFEMMGELKRRVQHQKVADKLTDHFRCEECEHRTICEQLELLFGEPNVEVHDSTDSLLRSIMKDLRS